jgi:N-acetylglutamate synthase-like GNAT family acetyltransferase
LSVTDELSIRHELRCGDLGRIISLHGEAYEPFGGYGLRFEAYVAQTIADFVLRDNAKGRIWLAERAGELVGCAAIALRENDAGQLRWVVVDPLERGNGLGKDLVARALAYCRDQDCRSVVLETTDGLPASEKMYEELGFNITSNTIEELWDGDRPLILMRLDL